MTAFDSRLFLGSLSTEPGVYRMLDKDGHVLYVGKARNLKKRVSSYFTRASTHGAKTRSLVNQIHSIDVTVTRSEIEALLLESNFIKTLRPKYNILMRDDKSYPFIHVSDHPFPRLSMVRCKHKPQKGGFYGPYPNASAVRETISLIQKIFNIRHCTDIYFNGRSRPCLQYQIKRCSAPCTGYISEKNYALAVKNTIQFLEGKSQDILNEIAERIKKAVATYAFEEAAVLRDQLKQLRLVQEQQGMVQLRGDVDVIVLEARPGFACIQYVTIREGHVLDSQTFFPSVPEQHFIEQEGSTLWQAVFMAFVKHHYLDTPMRIPAFVLTDDHLSEKAILEKVLSELRGKSCKIQTHPRGANARWLDFAHNNLKMAVTHQETSRTMMRKRFQALNEIGMTEIFLQHIECFDISHTQGKATVASCVVLDEHGPCKSEYRRFNIQGITPGDDCSAMEQAIMRRFKSRAKEVWPHLLLIDGGKAQVAVAYKVFTLLEIKSAVIVGIAKGPGRKAGLERLILEGGKKVLTLPPDSLALRLLQQARDEAHRFAITSHRKQRHKMGMHSSLETIAGIGAKRRHALLARFGGIRELARAPEEEIAKVHGISQALARRIYQHFHS